MDFLYQTIEELSVVKAKQKALEAEESALKEQLLALMRENDLNDETTDNGTVRIQRRNEKRYSQRIQEAERALKEDKTLADDMGDYEVVSIKESIVFVAPKKQ